MQKFLLIITTSLSLLVLFSCSKEKQLEKTLYKKDGNWTVKSADWERVSQSSTSGMSVTTGTSTDAGTFSFNESGSGSYNFTLGTNTYAESFTWTVSEESFSITKITQNIDFFSGEITQIIIAFSGSQIDKNTLEVSGSDTRQYTSGDISQTVMAGTFTLARE